MNEKGINEYFNRLDASTYNHSVRVAALAMEYERLINLGDIDLSQAALVHDLGKIYISTKILDKVGKLSLLEREIVDLHPYIGYRILRGMNVREEVCQIVLYHHGTRPPILSQIEPYDAPEVYDKALMLHTIDSFEALTSDRPYHRGCSAHEAMDIMFSEEGHHLGVMEYLSSISNETSGERAFVRNAYHREAYSIIDGLLMRCTAEASG